MRQTTVQEICNGKLRRSLERRKEKDDHMWRWKKEGERASFAVREWRFGRRKRRMIICVVGRRKEGRHLVFENGGLEREGETESSATRRVGRRKGKGNDSLFDSVSLKRRGDGS
jgi:hypothetical protein